MKALLRAVAPGALVSLALWAAVAVLWTREQAEQERLRARCETLEARARTLEPLAAKPVELRREVEQLRLQLEQLRGIAPPGRAEAERELRRWVERRGVELLDVRSEPVGEVLNGFGWVRLRFRLKPVGRSGLEALSDVDRWPLLLRVERLEVETPRDPEALLAASVLALVGRPEPAP